MTEIRAAMEAKKGKNKVSMLPAASYAQLGEKVSRSVKFIFKKCKLKPDADAMLHILLAKILNGVEKMKMENDPTEQVEGASAVGAALEEYSDFFNHPGWMSLRKN